jgi:hypothetical protein
MPDPDKMNEQCGRRYKAILTQFIATSLKPSKKKVSCFNIRWT